MAENAYWDDDRYVDIIGAHYDADHDRLRVDFADGDSVSVTAACLLRRSDGVPDWTHLRVEEGLHIRVPTDGEPIEIPGFTIRSITDPVFAAHLARAAEESARHVGERLQHLRKARGFTTREVAARVGMAQQNLSRIEQGRHAVSFPTLEKILAAMGYTLEDILPDEPIPSPQATSTA